MKIAIVGAGISGLTAAYLLTRDHEVVVFEANDYIGGHTNTIEVPLNGRRYSVDTGFIVFNLKTYPNFVTLLKQLSIGWKSSDMSFSVQCQKTGLEFCPSGLNALFAQRRNLVSPRFYRMIMDAFRFRRESAELMGSDTFYETTLEQYLSQNNYSQGFIEHFIIPMGEAIWSSDPVNFKKFPARYFVEFFRNHGILNVHDQPRWLVVEDGSSAYIPPLIDSFKENIYVSCPVDQIRREPDQVVLTLGSGETYTADAVVIATHSDQALKLLADPSSRERDILGDIAYQHNHTVLHADASMLPSREAAWASWNYYIPKEEVGRVAITYNMNRLQGLEAPEQFCVTLNRSDAITNEKMIRSIDYHHPMYTPGSLAARRRHGEINGVNGTYYCGAYWGYGFHEDGVSSALAVTKHFGIEL